MNFRFSFSKNSSEKPLLSPPHLLPPNPQGGGRNGKRVVKPSQWGKEEREVMSNIFSEEIQVERRCSKRHVINPSFKEKHFFCS